MQTQPPPIPAPDVEHLRLLSIFHYVLAVVTALFACIPIIHVVIGIMMVSGRFGGSGSEAAPAWMGYLFAGMGTLFVLLGWILAACTFFSGRFIAERRRRIFSIVVAAILCTVFPFGTILGIFTIIVLSRDSVRRLYGESI
jgi:hypothetical protein